MRAKEFISEAGLKPLKPLASVTEPAGSAPVDQAIAQANQPKGPGLASRALSGALSGAKTAASRFGQGFSAGFNSTLGPGGDALTKAGVSASHVADVARGQKAEAPFKQAFNIFAGHSTWDDVDPALVGKVRNILNSQYPQQAGWLDHVKKNTTPWDKPGHPLAGTDANAAKRINPNDVAAYLKQVSRGQKVNSTGNPEVDKVLKLAGIQ
jgi:hypothetical protein